MDERDMDPSISLISSGGELFADVLARHVRNSALKIMISKIRVGTVTSMNITIFSNNAYGNCWLVVDMDRNK
jgi:hypothetical protein